MKIFLADADVRKQLLADYNLEIGAGLGDLDGKVWRIGLMGYACNKKNINKGVAVVAAMVFYGQ
ncbi:purine catabolism protein PucG [bacterium BMS3Abin11]|nr:purine catabolism protein PucG [bacterium BMS3Abin11]